MDVQRLLRRVTGLLVLIAVPEVGAQNLTLTVSAAPPARGMVSTASRDDRSFVVVSGQTVSLQRASGLEQRNRAGSGWAWTAIEDVPRDAERLVLTPRLLDDGRIQASIESVRKEGMRLHSVSTTLVVEPGEWTALYSSGIGAAPQPRGTKSYGTSGMAGESGASGGSLYLRIDP